MIYIFYSIYVAIFLLLIYVVIRKIAEKRTINNSSVVEEKARLVKKQNEAASFRNAYTNHYFLTFQLENNDIIECTVKQETFEQLKENQTGILVHQHTKFFDFKK